MSRSTDRNEDTGELAACLLEYLEVFSDEVGVVVSAAGPTDNFERITLVTPGGRELRITIEDTTPR
jgi:hypothetical protein